MSDPCEGRELPEMELPTGDDKIFSLPNDCKGRWTILYFYPKDNTPGCTTQACGYRDSIAEFSKLGVQVVGVSLDDPQSHKKFQKKQALNFMLLSDTEHALSEYLGVYGDKKFMGKEYKGLSRDTFLIDPEGKIRKVWRKVNPKTTIAETYEEVVELLRQHS